MANQLGDYISQGILTGYGMRQKSRETKIKEDLAKLTQIRQQQEFALKQQAAAIKQEEEQWFSGFKRFDKYMDALNKLKDPVQNQTMVQGLKEMPFFKNATPEQQTIMQMGVVGSSDFRQRFNGALKKTIEGATSKDMDDMTQGWLEMQSLAAGNQDPSVKAALGTAGKVLLGQITPPAQTSVNVYTGDVPMSKSSQTKIEDKLMEAADQVTVLKELQTNFDKDLINFQGQLKSLGLKWKDFLGGKLTEENQDVLDSYVDVTQKTAEVVNEIRHALFGSALTKTEADAASMQLPTLKTGVLSRFTESDSPRAYKRKLDNILETSQRAVQRLEYALQNGTVIGYGTENVQFFDADGKPLRLTDPRFSDKKPSSPVQSGQQPLAQQAVALAEQLASENPNLSNEQIIEMVKSQLGR
jgi:hypothetical protein